MSMMHQPVDTSSDHNPIRAESCDWGRFGRHRFRAPNGAIIDVPVHVVAARVWVATLWPDARDPSGWARQLWNLDPAVGRGWVLPHQLAAGDVIEFGADTPQMPVRWYGIMDSYEVDRWATVQGPYPHPAAAYDEAQQLLALDRYVEPLQADPPHATVTADPVRRHRRDQRHRQRRHCDRDGRSSI